MSSFYNKVENSILLDRLSKFDDPISLTNFWASNIQLLEGCRMIQSFPREVGNNFSDKIISSDFDGKAFIRSHFKYPFLYFLNSNVIDHYSQRETAVFTVDYSLMFDSNFASYVETYVNRRSLGDNEEAFIKAINHIIDNELNLDIIPYLSENAELSKDPYHREFVLETTASFLQLSSAFKDSQANGKNIKFAISKDFALKQANDILYNLLETERGKIVTENHKTLFNYVYITLLNIIYIEFKFSKRSVGNKLKLLIEFMHNGINCILSRELIVALNFFKDRNSVGFFKQINMPSSKTISKLKNMSWDMFIFRLMERVTVSDSKNEFFIPLLITFDRNLVELFSYYPVKSGFINSTESSMISLPDQSLIDIVRDEIQDSTLEYYFSEDATRERFSRVPPSNSEVEPLIKDMEKKITAMFS